VLPCQPTPALPHEQPTNTLFAENDIITYHFLEFWNFKKIRI
jgi:hypothetical protein